MKLDRHTTLFIPDEGGSPVQYALESLRKDWRKIFGGEPRQVSEPAGHQIRLQFAHDLTEEGFRVSHRAGDDHLLIEGADDLGLVFGIYHLCEHILGVDPYAFWTDFVYPRHESLEVRPFAYTAPRPKMRWRGWFINDEDCLVGWDDSYSITMPLMEQICESSLRAGYNMIIPYSPAVGMDPQVKLVADMGMWITHHHVVVLGARPFHEAYPGVKPLYPEELDKWVNLFREGIASNRGRKMVWTVGFRGSGDHPFFHPTDDTRHDTYAKQGQIISDMVRLQCDLVREMTPGPHYFAHNLYAESMELYREGYLKLDDDVIRVWGDNGFGAMRRRRTIYQPERHMPALPGPEDRDKSNGMYYHVSFNDIRISNKLTPMVKPQLIQEQFQLAFDAGRMDYLTLNVSNIHPHVFNMELIGKITRHPAEEPRLPADLVDRHYAAWTGKHFGEQGPNVASLMRRYYDAPWKYGDYLDDLAGEQVYHHGLRNLIRGAVAGEPSGKRFCYFPGYPARIPSDAEIIDWHLERAGESLPRYEALLRDGQALHRQMSGPRSLYFHDSVLMHIRYLHASLQGFLEGLRALAAYHAGDLERALPLFSGAEEWMREAWAVLRENEHGRWERFFRGERTTGTRLTIRFLAAILEMCRIRLHDDEPREEWAEAHLGPQGRHRVRHADFDAETLGRAILRWERDGVDEWLEK